MTVHLGMADFVAAKSKVVLLGPPGTGKTHLAAALGVRACQAGPPAASATASHWVMRLTRAATQELSSRSCAGCQGSRAGH